MARVLITADPLGGVWPYTLELIRALAPHGFEFALATMGAPLRAEQRQAARSLPNLTAVYESAWRLEWMDDPWDDVRSSGEWLLGIAGQERPDLVHLNGYAHGALPWPAPAVVVGHSCVLSWWEAVKHEPAADMWMPYREAVAAGLSAAAEIVSPSHAMLAALCKHYGVNGGRIVPNARSMAPQPAPKAPFVLAAGRLWDEAKNIRALAEVAPRLPWPVYVAGEARGTGGFVRPEQRFDSVRLLGQLAPGHLNHWFAHAAIYALPARYEPFGLSVLEAAHAGCALVLGGIPSLRENWEDAALFVPPEDTAALEDAIREVITNPGLRTDLQVRARRRAATFTPERMAEGYCNAYARLTAAPPEMLCAS